MLAAEEVGVSAPQLHHTGRMPAVVLPRTRTSAARDPRPATLQTLTWWLLAIALTLLDAALTYTWITFGLAAEANPWLAELIATSGPGTAMAVRAGLGVALVGVLALLARDHASARRGLVLVSVVLALVVCWHVAGGVMVAVAS